MLRIYVFASIRRSRRFHVVVEPEELSASIRYNHHSLQIDSEYSENTHAEKLLL